LGASHLSAVSRDAVVQSVRISSFRATCAFFHRFNSTPALARVKLPFESLEFAAATTRKGCHILELGEGIGSTSRLR